VDCTDNELEIRITPQLLYEESLQDAAFLFANKQDFKE